MKKKLLYSLTVMVMLASCMCLTACEFSPDTLIQNVKNISSARTGDIKGQIGKTYKTAWFEFTIESIDQIISYDDYYPEEDSVLYEVVIEEKNTSKSSIAMGTFDFYIISPSLAEKFYPLDPLDEKMMPFEFDLGVNETVKYHMVYKVPKNTSDLMLKYIEIDDENNEGSTFTFEI